MNSTISARGALLTAALLALPLAACSGKNETAQDEAAQQVMPSGYGSEPQVMPAQTNVAPTQLDAWEKRDLGVKPQDTLHDGPAHGPTPVTIPGGKLITTPELLALQQSGQKLVLLEVLGAPQMLPNAFRAVPAAASGNFKDQTQQQFAQVLQQLTQGDKNTPIVTYCANPECWMSYNAALRAINAGYGNVSWYRGGLEAWERAGHPVSGGQPPANAGQPEGMPTQDTPPQNMPPPNYPQQPAYPQQPNTPPQYPSQQGYPQD